MRHPGEGTDARELLDELLGEHGRLSIAYRRAAAAARAQPAYRWDPVLHELHRALALASGLAAGHTKTPNGYDPGQRQACAGCGQDTAIRIYGHPWHYGCWLGAGCPVPLPEPPAATEQTAPAEAAALEEPVSGAESPAETPEEPGQGQPPDGAAEDGTEAFRRRAKDREPLRRFEVDPDEEAHDFARQVRKRNPDATDEQCAAALEVWHRCVTVRMPDKQDKPLAFVSWAGYTGVTLYELLTAAHGSMVQPEPLTSELVNRITREHTTHRSWAFVNADAAPVAGQGVTECDVTAQFLGAARSVECGDGEPDTLDEINPDWLPALTTKPGYVQLAAAPDLDGLPAPARYSFASLAADWWLPLPAARYLHHDHGVPLAVARAVLWPSKPSKRHGRRLDKWAGVVGEARHALLAADAAAESGAALALGVLKDMYAAFLGGVMRSERTNDRGTLRPDWNDMVVSTAGANALRALDKLPTEVVTLGGQRDAVWFLSAAEDAPYCPDALTFADQPGKWHLNRWGLVTEQLVTQHAKGRVGLIQKAIRDADATRKAEQ